MSTCLAPASMEAAPLRQGGNVTLTQPIQQDSGSNIEHVKNQLALIPSVPSSIVVPAITSFPISEHARSSTPSATGTASTEALTSNSTAATSVLELPRLFTKKKINVSPSMPIEDGIQAVWTKEIKPRLGAVLLHNIPTGTCVQEFMMAGKKPGVFRPALIISCGDRITKRRVEKTFKSQAWLQELLKANGIMFIALVGKTSLSAGPVAQSANLLTLEDAYLIQRLPAQARTSCGQAILANNSHEQRLCRLGGLLVVNGNVMGLTAAHAFEPPRGMADYASICSSLSDNDHVEEDLEVDETSDISDEPFVFNDDEESSDYSTDGSSISLQDDVHNTCHPDHGTPSAPVEYPKVPPRSKDWHVPETANVLLPTLSVHTGLDWALLESLPADQRAMPNKVAHLDPRNDVLIKDMALRSVHGEVTVLLADIGPQTGYLQSSPVTLKVHQTILDVQLVTLERTLPLGSSGAWVVLGDKLCGHIVAVREDVPWAYILPIGHIIDDIKHMLNTNDVKLPDLDVKGSKSALPPDAVAQEPPDSRNENQTPAHINEKSVSEHPSAEHPIAREEEKETESTQPPHQMQSRPARFRFPDRLSHSVPEPVDHPPVTTLVQMNTPVSSGQLPPTTSPFDFSVENTGRLDIPPLSEQMTVGLSIKARHPLLWHALTSPYLLWRRTETLILRTEYRRGCSSVTGKFTWWRLVRIVPRPTIVHDLNFPLTSGEDLLELCIHVLILLSILLDFLLNVLYFTLCCPILLLVWYRHRDVLTDEEVKQRQRIESIRMLGRGMPLRESDLILASRAEP